MADPNWPAWAWPLLLITVGGAVTYAWRFLGVALAGRIDAAGPLFRWIGCVAYALLAGLIARMIVLPIGPLQDTAIGARIAGAVAALAIFYLSRKNLLAGVLAGVLVLVALTVAGVGHV